MVYCGKPSKGCKNCRTRKIRCDQLVPTCTQCKRSGKECPGYRNMLDLAFRNESESVIEKAKAKSRKNLPRKEKTQPTVVERIVDWVASVEAPNVCQITDVSFTSPVLAVQPYLVPAHQPTNATSPIWTIGVESIFEGPILSTRPLYPTVEERGINFFFTNFVSQARGPSHGHFSYIPDLCRNGGMGDLLRVSMSAAGLASLANTSKSSRMMAQARKEYSTALQRINKALRSPSEVVKDGTLLSIIVLAIFEAIAGGRQLSFRDWTEHINGAATIVKLRGPSQLSTPVGFGLFIHATSHLLLSCLQREVPMPPQIMELRTKAFESVPLDPGWQYLNLTDQVSIFRSEISAGKAGNAVEVISRARKLDAEMVKIFTEAPLDWMYEVVYTNERLDVLYDNSYHVYFDVWVAQIWNAMRSIRIMLNELIRGQLLRGFSANPNVFATKDFAAQFHDSTDNIARMRDDILRTVPQHFGFVNRKPYHSSSNDSPLSSAPSSNLQNLPTLDGFDMSTNTSNKGTNNPNHFSFSSLLLSTTPLPSTHLHRDMSHPSIGAYFLLWPLYMSGITPTTPTSARLFASKMLRYAGEEMGMKQGLSLAAYVEEHAQWCYDDETSVKAMMALGGAASMLSLEEFMRRERMKSVMRPNGLQREVVA